ncbi:mechanosensitive ion channel family protein [Croceicoccus sp. YJ47]|uniref:mechanosensitive ion channel family protein n=1 Tax=Croceicoccus sp. YJ47 TaxID=2798724 RepID=UPI001F02D925|nr:mechanosensitive ion channel domain-containing protein [Croceicoccus sp. YJ47]
MSGNPLAVPTPIPTPTDMPADPDAASETVMETATAVSRAADTASQAVGGEPLIMPSPTPTAEAPDAVSGADEIREAVASQNLTIGEMIGQLDAIGFTVGDTRFSLWTVMLVAIVIVGVFVLARLGSRLGSSAVGKLNRLSPTQTLLAEKLITLGVWAMAILIGVDILGIDLTALAVFSGAFGLAIGFGLQKTFGNLIAGMILLMDRSIKPGDVIAVADQTGNESFGQIRKIGIRAVSVTTRDEREYLIPNENLMINQVENWSYSSRNVRFQIPVGISYSCDIALAEELMLEAAKSSKRVLQMPAPSVWLSGYGDSSVDFVIHCWIRDPEEGVGNVKSEVLKKLWYLFQDAGVEIPFPQRDINLRNNEQFEQIIAALSQRMEQRAQDPKDTGEPSA